MKLNKCPNCEGFTDMEDAMCLDCGAKIMEQASKVRFSSEIRESYNKTFDRIFDKDLHEKFGPQMTDRLRDVCYIIFKAGMVESTKQMEKL